MKKTTSLFLGLLLVFLSCKKDSSVEATKENLAGAYNLLKFEIVANGSSSDLTRECQKDDLYKFNLDSTHQVLDEAVTCSPSSNLTGGKWWVEEYTYLVIKPGSESQSYRIMRFNGEDLVLTLFAGTQLQTFYLKKKR